MSETDTIDVADVMADHLYICTYDGQETLSVGRDIELWNEGLPDHLVAHRDLGRIIHSWTVTEAGVHELRTEQITDEGTLVLIPNSSSQQNQPIIVEDVNPTPLFPTELLTVSQLNTIVSGTDADVAAIDAAELSHLAEQAREITNRINSDIESAFEARYESWLADTDPYPDGQDFGYEIPLEADWKRDVIADRTDLSSAQVSLIANAGFPASMRVTVDVDIPAAVEDRIDG